MSRLNNSSTLFNKCFHCVLPASWKPHLLFIRGRMPVITWIWSLISRPSHTPQGARNNNFYLILKNLHMNREVDFWRDSHFSVFYLMTTSPSEKCLLRPSSSLPYVLTYTSQLLDFGSFKYCLNHHISVYRWLFLYKCILNDIYDNFRIPKKLSMRIMWYNIILMKTGCKCSKALQCEIKSRIKTNT